MPETTLFTSGKIAPRLLRFALPVLGALFLQSFYGAVDLLIVGQFGNAADVSAVATGTMMMQTITFLIVGLAMGTTIQMGQALGAGKKEMAANIVGTSVIFFALLAVLVSVLMIFLTEPFALLMQTPKEAFDKTCIYVHICSAGTIFITAYNMMGGVFRGMGDSKTPLLTVLVACIINVFGDLLFVAVFHMAASGAALATVIAQALSVLFCLIVAKKRGLPFSFSKKNIRWKGNLVALVCKTGAPISLQDGLVTVSFLVIAAIINRLGLIASAGVGVAERVCGFIMLVPSAFSQSLSAFVAQNIGAHKYDRAKKALLYSIAASLACGIFMGYFAFFHGNLLAAIFSKNAEVIAAAHSYLKAYAIDTLFVSFLFCFIGYFNGCGKTSFVMIQGILGAFGVRIPVSYIMSRTANPTLFRIGLATPSSTFVQIILCGIVFLILERKNRNSLQNGDLLFMSDTSEFSKAIIETTEKFSHVGIYFDGMLYHASRKRGVTKQNLEEYLAEEKHEVYIYRYPEIDAGIVKEKAEKYLGREYNHSFYPDNGKFYCSQYIAEILPIFDTMPMKFGDGKNEISDYWKKYYEELGLSVPVNQPGTNPGQLAKSEKLHFIGKLD